MIKKGAGIALLFFGLIFFLFPFPSASQIQHKIKEVAVEGNKRVTTSLITGVSSLDLGSELNAGDVSETLKRLYKLGIFSDIQIEVEPLDDGVKVYIIVVELPKLAALNFEGNKAIKSKDFISELGLGVGGYISPHLVEEKRIQILDKYSERGYFRAEVSSKMNYSADSSEATLTYSIIEKSKVKVQKVILSGAEKVNPKDIIKVMRNRKRGFLKSSDFAQDKYEEDKQKIIEAYKKRGFLDAFLKSDSLTIDSLINRMTVYLDIYEGPKYYFGDVKFSDNEKFPDRALASKLKFNSDEVFDNEKYEESIFELYTLYQEIGHLHIQIQDVRTTRADSIIDITYKINEGLPSKINMVNIVGNTKTKERVLRREISTLPGQTFNRSLLIRSVRDVMALNYFNNVVPVPIDLPNGDVDIEFQVEEKQTGQISAGAGYNSRDNLVGTLGMSIPNFRGNGQNVSFNIEFGNNRNTLLLSFTEPWMFGRPTLFGTDAYTTRRRWFTDYTEGRKGASFKIGRRLRWPDNYFRVFATYRFEQNRFSDFSNNFELQNSLNRIEFYYNDSLIDTTSVRYLDRTSTFAEDPLPGSILTYKEQWLTASRLSLTITRDSRNLPEFATSGSKIVYTFEHTGGFLTGYWNYQKHSITISKFFPIWGKLSLATKFQYGSISSPQGDDRILISDRFLPGGTAYDGIVRGYDDGVLTPDSLITIQDERNFFTYDSTISGYPSNPDSIKFASRTPYRSRIRGKYMLVTNLELQFPLIERQIYALMFFDAGNSWIDRSHIRPFDGLYRGFGFGFRVVVPAIGIIGFDFAKRLDEYNGVKGNWKTHFQLGTAFR